MSPPTNPADVPEVLRIEELDTDLYRGHPAPAATGRVFGGQVIAQALAAATGSLEVEKDAHSLHAYFLRPGNPAQPILYRVARDFDGGSFANRRVVAMQGGKAILNFTASFHKQEGGLSHAATMPEASDPETAPTMAQVIASDGVRTSDFAQVHLDAFDLRVGGSHFDPATRQAVQHGWLRLPESLAHGSTGTRVALAYISDFGLIATPLVAHGRSLFETGIQTASLDHAMWFHAAPPVGEWLLYTMTSPWSGAARAFAHGSIYSRSGQRIASVAQEGLVRYRSPKETG